MQWHTGEDSMGANHGAAEHGEERRTGRGCGRGGRCGRRSRGADGLFLLVECLKLRLRLSCDEHVEDVEQQVAGSLARHAAAPSCGHVTRR